MMACFPYPEDGKLGINIPPYSASGLKSALPRLHKPLFGPRAVFPSTAQQTIPGRSAIRWGFSASADFYQILATRAVHPERSLKIVVMYEFEKRWRSIWMDRELPKEIPGNNRWYGFIRLASGPKRHHTLVVQTVGIIGEPRAWRWTQDRPSPSARTRRSKSASTAWTTTIWSGPLRSTILRCTPSPGWP